MMLNSAVSVGHGVPSSRPSPTKGSVGVGCGHHLTSSHSEMKVSQFGSRVSSGSCTGSQSVQAVPSSSSLETNCSRAKPSGPVTITTVPAPSISSSTSHTSHTKPDNNSCDNSTAPVPSHPNPSPPSSTTAARPSFTQHRHPSPSSSGSSGLAASTTPTSSAAPTNYILLNKLRIQQQKPRRLLGSLSGSLSASSKSSSFCYNSPTGPTAQLSTTAGLIRSRQLSGVISPNSQSSLVRSSSVSSNPAAAAGPSPIQLTSSRSGGNSSHSSSNRIITRVNAQDWLSANGRQSASSSCKKDPLVVSRSPCEPHNINRGKSNRSSSQATPTGYQASRNPPSLVSVRGSVSSPCNSLQGTRTTSGSVTNNRPKSDSAASRANGRQSSSRASQSSDYSPSKVRVPSAKSVASVGTNTPSSGSSSVSTNKSLDPGQSDHPDRGSNKAGRTDQSKPTTGAKSITITGVRMNRNHVNNSSHGGSTVYTITSQPVAVAAGSSQSAGTRSQPQPAVVSLTSRLKPQLASTDSVDATTTEPVTKQTSSFRINQHCLEDNSRPLSNHQRSTPLLDFDHSLAMADAAANDCGVGAATATTTTTTGDSDVHSHNQSVSVAVSSPTTIITTITSSASIRSEPESESSTMTAQPTLAKLRMNELASPPTLPARSANHNDDCSGFSVATTALCDIATNGPQVEGHLRSPSSGNIQPDPVTRIEAAPSDSATSNNGMSGPAGHSLLSFIEQSSPELIFLLNENAKLAYHLSLFESKLTNLEKIFSTNHLVESSQLDNTHCSSQLDSCSISWSKIIARTRRWIIDVRRKNVFLANFDLSTNSAIIAKRMKNKKKKKSSLKSKSPTTTTNNQRHQSSKSESAALSDTGSTIDTSRPTSRLRLSSEQPNVSATTTITTSTSTESATAAAALVAPSGFALSSEDELIILLDRIAQFSSNIISKRQSLLDVRQSKSPTAPSADATLTTSILSSKNQSHNQPEQSYNRSELLNTELLRSRWLASLPPNTKLFLGELLNQDANSVPVNCPIEQKRTEKSSVNLNSTFERIYALKPEILNALIENVKTGARLIQLGREFDHLTCVYLKSIGGSGEQLEQWSQQQYWSSMLADQRLSSASGTKSWNQVAESPVAQPTQHHKMALSDQTTVLTEPSSSTAKHTALLGSCGCGCGATNFVSDGDSGGEFTTTTVTNEFVPSNLLHHHHQHHHHHHQHHHAVNLHPPSAVHSRNHQQPNEDGTDELSSLLNQIALCSQKIIEQSGSGSSTSGSSASSSNHHGITPAGAGVSSNSTASSGCCCSSTILLDGKYGSVPGTITGSAHHGHLIGQMGSVPGQSHSIGGTEWPLFDDYHHPVSSNLSAMPKHRPTSTGCGCPDCQQQRQQRHLKSQATYPNLHQLSELTSLSASGCKPLSRGVYQPVRQPNRWPGGYHGKSSLTFEDNRSSSSSSTFPHQSSNVVAASALYCDNSGTMPSSSGSPSSEQLLYNGRSNGFLTSSKYHHPHGHTQPHPSTFIPSNPTESAAQCWPLHDDPLLMPDCLAGGSSAVNFMLSSSAIDILSSPTSALRRQSHPHVQQQQQSPYLNCPPLPHYPNLVAPPPPPPLPYGSRPVVPSASAFIFDPNVDVENFLYEVEKELDDNCYASAPPFLSRQQQQQQPIRPFAEPLNSNQSGTSHRYPAMQSSGYSPAHQRLYPTSSSQHQQQQQYPYSRNQHQTNPMLGHSSNGLSFMSPLVNLASSAGTVTGSMSSSIIGPNPLASAASVCCSLNSGHSRSSNCASGCSPHSTVPKNQSNNNGSGVGAGSSQQLLPSLLAGGNWRLSQRNLAEQSSPAAAVLAQQQHSPNSSTGSNGHFPFPATTSMPLPVTGFPANQRLTSSSQQQQQSQLGQAAGLQFHSNAQLQSQPISPNQSYRHLIVPSASRDLLDKFRTQVCHRVNVETDHQLREIDQWLHHHLQNEGGIGNPTRQLGNNFEDNNSSYPLDTATAGGGAQHHPDEEDNDNDDDEIIVVVEGLANQCTDQLSHQQHRTHNGHNLHSRQHHHHHHFSNVMLN